MNSIQSYDLETLGDMYINISGQSFHVIKVDSATTISVKRKMLIVRIYHRIRKIIGRIVTAKRSKHTIKAITDAFVKSRYQRI